MYHAHFRGTHYEAGFRWGSLLLKHKNIILENIPFEITQERIDYALSCLPIYEKYYHEIVEKFKVWQMDNNVMSVFCKLYYLVCTLCLHLVIALVLLLQRNRKFFWDETVIF
mgnify:CR=1 FL=1